MKNYDPFNIPFISVASTNARSTQEILPEEEKLLSPKATQKRRQDFILGRTAAREALRMMGGPTDIPILSGTEREPLFPKGYVGSISHGGGLAVAAVTQTSDAAGIGIDIQETSERFHEELIAQFASPSEMSWIMENDNLIHQRACTIFSAKETFFKAVYPIVRFRFGFEAIELNWLPEREILAVTPKISFGKISPDTIFEINVISTEKFVVTGLAIQK